MMQPSVINGAVENPNSSAPNKAAIDVYASEVGGEVLTWEELGQRAMPRLATKIFSDKLSKV